ncbi:hypothetical protein HK102_000512, partial [Quaeritorhiza haematococci]
PGDDRPPVPCRLLQDGKEERGVLRQPDRPGRDLQGAAEQELPDEQELERAARPGIPVGRIEEVIRPPGARERRGQLAPDEAVGQRHQGAEDPPQHRLGPAHRGDDGRYGDEGPHAHHHRHVQADRLQQAQSTLQHRKRPGRLRLPPGGEGGPMMGRHGLCRNACPPHVPARADLLSRNQTMADKNSDLHGFAPDKADGALLLIDVVNGFDFPAADKLLAELEFDYDGALIPAGRTTPLAVSPELGLVIRRDHPAAAPAPAPARRGLGLRG